MKVIRWALWNTMLFQLLLGRAAAKETNKNYIRGRRNEESEARIKYYQSTTEFTDFFGGNATVEESSPDPVTVYMLFLFDLTSSEHFSWTIRVASTLALVESAPKGKYASRTDFTELVQLVPGTTYELELVDDSLASSRDRVGSTFTDFSIVVSEPAQEIATGTVASGETKFMLFTIPGAERDFDQEPVDLFQLETGNITLSDDLVDDFVDVGEDLLFPSEAPSAASSSSPSVVPSDSPSQSPVTATPTLEPTSSPVSPSSVPSDLPSISTNSSESPSTSPIQAPVPSPLSCAAKGDSCESSTDCCGSGRCSPQKICFSIGSVGRDRITASTHGGAAGDISRRNRRQRYGFLWGGFL